MLYLDHVVATDGATDVCAATTAEIVPGGDVDGTGGATAVETAGVRVPTAADVVVADSRNLARHSVHAGVIVDSVVADLGADMQQTTEEKEKKTRTQKLCKKIKLT